MSITDKISPANEVQIDHVKIKNKDSKENWISLEFIGKDGERHGASVSFHHLPSVEVRLYLNKKRAPKSGHGSTEFSVESVKEVFTEADLMLAYPDSRWFGHRAFAWKLASHFRDEKLKLEKSAEFTTRRDDIADITALIKEAEEKVRELTKTQEKSYGLIKPPVIPESHNVQ